MPNCSAFLLVAVILLVVVGSQTPAIANRVQGQWAKLTRRSGMTNDESIRTMSRLDRVFTAEDSSAPDPIYPKDTRSTYDPVHTGALKLTEIEAHKRSLRDMSPFANTGPTKPESFLRDDDPYYLNTGIRTIGGTVPRSLRKVVSGPQVGARQVTSTSEADLRNTHVAAAMAPINDY